MKRSLTPSGVSGNNAPFNPANAVARLNAAASASVKLAAAAANAAVSVNGGSAIYMPARYAATAAALAYSAESLSVFAAALTGANGPYPVDDRPANAPYVTGAINAAKALNAYYKLTGPGVTLGRLAYAVSVFTGESPALADDDAAPLTPGDLANTLYGSYANGAGYRKNPRRAAAALAKLATADPDGWGESAYGALSARLRRRKGGLNRRNPAEIGAALANAAAAYGREVLIG